MVELVIAEGKVFGLEGANFSTLCQLDLYGFVKGYQKILCDNSVMPFISQHSASLPGEVHCLALQPDQQYQVRVYRLS